MENQVSNQINERKKRMITGSLIAVLGLSSFFFFMSYFDLFSHKIDYSIDIPKLVLVYFICLPLAAFGCGYAVLNKRFGLWLATWFFVILGLAYIHGFIKNVYFNS